MSEILGLHRFAYSRLAADPELAALVGGRIYEGIAPPGTEYPLVLFGVQAGTDLLGAGGTRIWVSAVLQARAVGPMPASELAPIAARIDAALTAPMPIAVEAAGVAYTIHAAYRESTIDYAEVVDGRVYRHLGGLFRAFCSVREG